jgi:hypothetical protein
MLCISYMNHWKSLFRKGTPRLDEEEEKGVELTSTVDPAWKESQRQRLYKENEYQIRLARAQKQRREVGETQARAWRIGERAGLAPYQTERLEEGLLKKLKTEHVREEEQAEREAEQRAPDLYVPLQHPMAKKHDDSDSDSEEEEKEDEKPITRNTGVTGAGLFRPPDVVEASVGGTTRKRRRSKLKTRKSRRFKSKTRKSKRSKLSSRKARLGKSRRVQRVKKGR